MPFWQIVDRLRNPASAASQVGAIYLLPVLGSCPSCRSPIDEVSLVTPDALESWNCEPVLTHTGA
jgi:hypothetical protein